MSTFREFIRFLLEVLAFLIFVRAILSWFTVSRYNPIIVVLDYGTEPILAPLRRIVPRIGMIDITPMVAIVILLVVASFL